MGEILKQVTDHDFHISNIKMTTINREEALEIFKPVDNEIQNVIDTITSGTIVALEILSQDCNARWLELTAAFEKDAVLNNIYVPDNKDIGHYFFSSEKKKKCRMKNSAKLQNCTCCIIKPHAVQARLTAQIIDDIQKANFTITAAQQFFIDPVNAEEFLEVYKGVLPDYAAMVNELQSGPCIAMEITHSNANIDIVAEFRKLCGPMDPEMAVQLRPTSLRAKYGKSKVQNAVHCSDLSEDGVLENASKVSRSAARHIRRKRLIAARKETEKLELSLCNSISNQQIISVEKEIPTNVCSLNEKSINIHPLKITFDNDETTSISTNVNILKYSKNIIANEVVEKHGSLTNQRKQDKSIHTTHEQKNIASTVANTSTYCENFIIDCNYQNKMNNQEKPRDNVESARKARKAAKAATKTKAKEKPKTEIESLDQVDDAQLFNVKEKINHNLQNESLLENLAVIKEAQTEVKSKTFNKKSEDNAKPSEEIKIDANTSKIEEKSKSELRAERRAKQEAQRAAKQEAQRATKQAADNRAVKKISEKISDIKLAKSIEPKEPEKQIITKPQAKSNPHEVKLFKHLYINRKNISEIVSGTMKLHPVILRLGVQYAEKIIVGSNARCVALLAAIKQLINDFERPSQADFTRGLETSLQESVNYLNSFRPSAVSMQNALKHLKWQMSILSTTISDEEAKSKLAHAIDTYIREQILLADTAISDAIQKKISRGDVILTYGFSSLMYKILCDAFKAKKQFRVIIIDSRPWLEGKELLRRLVKHGIDCSYMLINALSYVMPQVNKVFLGAHAILANGAVMSRIGTAQIALMAKSFNVPVLVACETYKSCERVQTDSIVYNEIGDPDLLIKNTLKKSSLANWRSKKTLNLLNITYDVTPADLVTAVVTELAILPCTSVPVILRIKPSEM
ncbi:translation initiation factor eIF-2B subunit delta-like isoform X2 [Phymastichus coffea]|nr:translation initiation factor eIF-2B subunit delta-like isoform X2 [Phymastichus coffea]